MWHPRGHGRSGDTWGQWSTSAVLWMGTAGPATLGKVSWGWTPSAVTMVTLSLMLMAQPEVALEPDPASQQTQSSPGFILHFHLAQLSPFCPPSKGDCGSRSLKSIFCFSLCSQCCKSSPLGSSFSHTTQKYFLLLFVCLFLCFLPFLKKNFVHLRHFCGVVSCALQYKESLLGEL